MGMKYAEKPFNMGMLFYPRRPSKWVHIQTLNTHIRAFLYWSGPPGCADKPISYSPQKIHCTKYADIRRRIYQRRVKKQHLRIYYSHLYHTVFPCNHLISTAGLSFLPHITSIPLLFGFVFVQPPLNPPLF